MSMNLKLNFIFVLTASMLGLVLFSAEGGPVSGGHILSDRTIHVTGSAFATIQIQDDWNLADKITEAKELLEQSPPLRFIEESKKDKKGRVVKKNGKPVIELVSKEVALAILDTRTGGIVEKRYWLDMSEINKASDLRKKYQNNPDNLPKFRSENPGEEFQVVNNWWNSFNSDWSISVNGTVEGRYVVAADKYLMVNEDLAYPEDRTGLKYSDVVYVPYSPALKDKTLVAAGKAFLNEHVRQAFDE